MKLPNLSHWFGSKNKDDYSRRMRTILLNQGDPKRKRQDILEYFNQTFSLYESLFTLLNSDQAYYVIADPLRHPLIFYYAHTATFFINKLIAAKIIDQRINPHFESLFSVGVDEMSWDDLNKTQYDWPSQSAVQQYRNKVREVVNAVIAKIELKIPITAQDPAWIILMGIEHERIHLETSSVLIRQLPLELVTPNLHWQPCAPSREFPPANELIAITGREVRLGKSSDAPTFGWDNEYGELSAQVENFNVSKYLVSNNEFREFIADGGYAEKSWWTEEGWKWCQYMRVAMPRFWRLYGDQFFLRLMAEDIPMPWDWPVEVNYLESKAFCNWKAHKLHKKIRLPTEAEWRVLRDEIKAEYPTWSEAVGNIDLAYYASPCPVTLFKQGKLYDVIGNVWQWTETPIREYPGFQAHPVYEDFSIPTFDGKHNLIKGGSWISTGNEVIKESRYAFRRHFYQHAGLRYVESNCDAVTERSAYEKDTLLSQYLELHFGPPYFAVDSYPKVIAEFAVKFCDKDKRKRALDLGCAVGRTAFELSKSFEQVVALDFSVRFINAAVQLQTLGSIKYPLLTEGDLYETREVHLRDIGISLTKAQKVNFIQGDACNLQPQLSQFDLICASNLIDRLYDPAAFLRSIHEHLQVGGILLLSSPYTWLEEFTEKAKWIGGTNIQGMTKTTLAGLQEILLPHFELVTEPCDLPFVIRETARKFQHIVGQVTVWRRR